MAGENLFIEAPPEDIDPWSIASHTNFGATGMLNQLAAAGKASQQRQNSIAGMLQQINQMNSASINAMSPNISGKIGRAPRIGPGRHHGGGGKIKGPRNLKLAALAHAIGQQESGGNYNAVNPYGYKGKYQIIPGNIAGKGGWDVEALGHNVSYRKYASSPRIQERIALHKMRQYIRQYGLRGAAQAWYGGPGAVGNNNISGGAGYPTTGGYADSIMNMVRHYIRRHRR